MKTTTKQREDYPLVLTVDHIQEILGVGRRVAYELMKEKDFPVIAVNRKFKRVHRDKFFEWMEKKSS